MNYECVHILKKAFGTASVHLYCFFEQKVSIHDRCDQSLLSVHLCFSILKRSVQLRHTSAPSYASQLAASVNEV